MIPDTGLQSHTRTHAHTCTHTRTHTHTVNNFSFMHLPLKVSLYVVWVSVCSFGCGACFCVSRINKVCMRVCACACARSWMHAFVKRSIKSSENVHSFSNSRIPSERPGREKHVDEFTKWNNLPGPWLVKGNVGKNFCIVCIVCIVASCHTG